MVSSLHAHPSRAVLARRACVLAGGFLVAVGLTVAPGCSNSNPSGATIFTDSGGIQTTGPSMALTSSTGQSAQAFTPPGDPGAGSVYVTISGESNAITGYPFPPGDWTNDTYLIDGWQFVIKEYLVNIDKVTLWSSPNESPTSQRVHGPAVGHLDGPFVVDLHKGGSLVGQGGSPEQATPLGAITSQNDNGGAAFDPTTTYGFGFSTVAASYAGYNVNLTADEADDFAFMVQNGYSVLYVGTVQWYGDQSPYGCSQTSTGSVSDAGDAGLASDGGASGGYDFTQLPPAMSFRFGFSTPTDYVNCQNMTLQGTPNAGEDYPRGIQVSTSQSAVAQVTVHMDHPFWESFAEDSPVHWDQIAAQYVGVPGTPEAHVEDLKGVPFYAVTDRTGAPVPWRNCSGSFYTPPGNGQMFFNPLSVPVDPQGTCVQGNCPAIRDYYDYIRYTQSTQGHMNSQGLCYIDRQYPAPAGGS